MNEELTSFRKALVHRLFPRYSETLDKINKNALYFEHVVNEFKNKEMFENRYEMYEWVNDLMKGQPIDYLEFGVWKGGTIAKWASLNTNERSRFYGFDSFEGMPEAWDGEPKGYLNVEGRLPTIDDQRVDFIKGLFQDTLPTFLKAWEPRSQLIVHIDADLYSSTLFCLTQLDRILLPGSIIIFDEFDHLLDEFSAFYDYTRSYYRHWRGGGVVKGLYQVVVHLL